MTTSPFSPLSPALPLLGPLGASITCLKLSKLQGPYQTKMLSLIPRAHIYIRTDCMDPFHTLVVQAMGSENLGQTFRGVTFELNHHLLSTMGQRPGSRVRGVEVNSSSFSPALQKPGQA